MTSKAIDECISTNEGSYGFELNGFKTLKSES